MNNRQIPVDVCQIVRSWNLANGALWPGGTNGQDAQSYAFVS